MRYRASHSVVCRAAPERVYRLISRTADWPQIITPCEAVTVLAADRDTEHVRITARAHGRELSWESLRRLRPEVHGVDATIVAPMPLVSDMTTTWRVVGLHDGSSLLLLEHEYGLRADVTGQVPGVDDRADAERWIAEAIDANSRRELGDFRAAAEAPSAAARTFHARHTAVCGAPADAVYALIRSTEAWPQLFPACLETVSLDRDGDDELVRITALQDGRRVSWDTLRTYHDGIRRIDYRLPVPMPLLEWMAGQWRVVPLDGTSCVLTVDRSWRVLPEVAGIIPGIGTVAQAAQFVGAFVDTNATTEMEAIGAAVEEPVRV